MSPQSEEPLASVHSLRDHRKRGISFAQWPITLVLIGLSLSLVVVEFWSFRRGSIMLSAFVTLAFFLRLLLPDADAGWLVARSKRVDVIVLAALAIGLTVMSFWVPNPS
ncbi:MAG: DUF3017 domain-containing protein [Actinobacteria bacterium]|uniref:Unannotated protein n=1 Tax=freshwater metagenome TaxID=449393 RepID=A0A6J7S8A7_9ZZZZ|nr:DUF3017 domain-containing protein [Actinomycetota bacterium]MTB27508.1 DUF3017 domain-containing protein [Actinomycetota bacterium]